MSDFHGRSAAPSDDAARQQFPPHEQHPDGEPGVNSRPLSATLSPTTSSLDAIAQRVLWLSTAMIDAANRRTHPADGVKIGGHQASSASMVGIMTALWFTQLGPLDRVSVKPHASPVLHAINHLLGQLDVQKMGELRALGGLQPYPSRTKDPDPVDFSTGSVGIGATAAIWAALSHRYLREHVPETPPAGRFWSLLGDAELDEGATWEAIIDPEVRQLGEVNWIVDLNRQSLDRVIPDVQIARLQGMFAAADWQVVTLKWGSRLEQLFAQPGGEVLRRRLDDMPNEEYQRILRAHPDELHRRLLDPMTPADRAELEPLLTQLTPQQLAEAVRDLAGHDLAMLSQAFDNLATDRPSVVFAYTIKGKGLATEGHPGNHSALLSTRQMADLARLSGADPDDPWAPLPADSPETRLCAETARRLRREAITPAIRPEVPAELGLHHKAMVSTQASFGRLLSDLHHTHPELARRVVTLSPDVATSTNLAGWINKTGVWSLAGRNDWFADDPERVMRWHEQRGGQHVELGIAEVNLMGLASELGSTWSRWGQPLVPIATLYDPFVNRALEPWSFGLYAGGQSIVVGTPSGVTLAPEGGAHQSSNTPSVTLETPQLVSWEPAFAQDLEWTMLHAISRIGTPDGCSAYFRLTTRIVDQSLARVPVDEQLRQRRRDDVLAGGYRLSGDAATDEVTLVGVGAVMPQVCEAAARLEQLGTRAGVICLTSPDLVFRSMQDGHGIVDRLFPRQSPAPLVTVLDGHPHTLAFLAGIRGDRCRNLGVSTFGQGSHLEDAYVLHGIDEASITSAALDLLGR